MVATQKLLMKLLKFLGILISWIFKGILILVLLLFIFMGIKIIERWNKPMQIPEAQGMIYGELIHDRLDGWNLNQAIYGESTMHCKVLWGGGLLVTFPLQITYTYLSYNPESWIIKLLDSRDIRNGYIPELQPNNIFASWWWTVEKFTWGILVNGPTGAPTKLCRLSVPQIY